MIKNEIVKAYDEYKENIKRFQDPIQEQDPAVVILITPKALAELMCERKYDIRIDGKANCYFTSMFGKRTPIAIRWDLPGNVKFVIQGQSEYERQEKEKLLDKFKRMFEDGGRRMKADEMFEILGYEKCSAIDDEEYITFSRRTGKYIEYIIFDKLEKSVAKWRVCHCCNTIQYQAINMEELQAINKKCEELGWK